MLNIMVGTKVGLRVNEKGDRVDGDHNGDNRGGNRGDINRDNNNNNGHIHLRDNIGDTTIGVIQQLVDFYLKEDKNKQLYALSEECLNDPKILINKTVSHLQYLFQISSFAGLLPRMNQIYSSLEEHNNFLNIINDLIYSNTQIFGYTGVTDDQNNLNDDDNDTNEQRNKSRKRSSDSKIHSDVTKILTSFLSS